MKQSDEHGTDKKSAKSEPDVSKLWKASPSKIPKKALTPDVQKEEVEQKYPIPWRQLSIMAMLIILVGVIAHISGLFGGPVFLDNYNLGHLQVIEDADRFFAGLFATGFLHPFTQPWLKASYAMDVQQSQMSFVWLHFVNLVLHVLTSLYLFVLIVRLGRIWKVDERLDVDPNIMAFAAALIFVCHPLATQTVAYVSGRDASLQAVNYFLSLNCFLMAFLARGTVAMLLSYLVLVGLMAMALFCGIQAISLPISMFVVAMLLKPDDIKTGEWTSLRFPDFLLVAMAAIGFPLVALTGVYTDLTDGIGLPTPSTLEYLMAQFSAFAFYYLRAFIVPVGLSIEPPLVMSGGPHELLAVVGLAVLGGLLYLMWRFRRTPPLVLGFFLLIAGLVPYAIFVQPELVSDRRFYISLAGAALLVAYPLSRLALTSFNKAAMGFAVLIAVFTGLSVWRSFAWSSEQSLWTETLRTNPGSSRAHAMLALQHLAQEKKDLAKKEAEEALKLDPESVPGHLALAKLALVDKNFASAQKELEKAVALAQAEKVSAVLLAECRGLLADAYMSQGMYAKARPLLDLARRERPDDASLHLLLGKAFLEEGKPVQAMLELRKGYLKDKANVEYFAPLAQAFLDARVSGGMAQQGYMMAERAMMVTPSLYSFQLLARAALFTGQFEVADEWIRQCMKKDAKNATTLYLKSILERELGKTAESEKTRGMAIAIDPKIETKVPMLSHKDMQEMHKNVKTPSLAAPKPAVDVAEPEPPGKTDSQSPPAQDSSAKPGETMPATGSEKSTPSPGPSPAP